MPLSLQDFTPEPPYDHNMKSVKIFILGLMTLLLSNFSLADDIIVKFKSGFATPNELVATSLKSLYPKNTASLAVIKKHSNDTQRFNTADLTPNEIDQLIASLNANEEVIYAERNHRVYLALTPNDTEFINQWGLTDVNSGISMEDAWDVSTGDNTIVAVIDTGRLDHTDISGRYVSGYDFYSETGNDLNGNPLDNDGDIGRDSDPTDPGDARAANDCGFPIDDARDSSWHGLRVSSVIAANTDNNAGIAGINWSANIMPIRALGKCGGTLVDIADSIRWAAGVTDANLPAPPTVPANVINLSLGGETSCSTTLQDAIDDAVAAGATVIAAAGNEDADVSTHTPANCNNVIAVAASNISADATYYTNYGEAVDITAPGGELFQDTSGTIFGFGIPVLSNAGASSAATESIDNSQGTSFSAPHVSGVASLLYAVRPDILPTQVENIIKLTANAFPTGGFCNTTLCGYGLLNASYAVQFAESDSLFGTSIDSVSFTSDQACMIESQGSGSLTLRRSGTGLGVISLSYRTIDLSAQGGSDYETIESSIVVWNDGDLADKTINVNIVDDANPEATEAFAVVLTDISAGGSFGNNQQVTVTIQSDDNGLALCDNNLHSGGKLSFVDTNQTISETAGTVELRVRRESGSSGSVSINYQTLAGGATANEDYTAASGSLVWADGDTADKTITITINDDSIAEAKENFSVEIYNNSNNTIINGNTVSVVVIESDEKAGGGASWLLVLLSLLIILKRRR